MRRELGYFYIENALGWNQSWFQDWMMYHGGCAAVTACDLCVYLAREKEMRSLYPYDAHRLNRKDYLSFSGIMKPYLHPRLRGIDTLKIYISGLTAYWHDVGADYLSVDGLSGTASWEEAREQVREQIDSGMIVPFLLLHHKSRALSNYQWHWFNLAGYKDADGRFYVKAVTYGSFRWLDLRELWDTGYRKKGGLIIIREGDRGDQRGIPGWIGPGLS